MAKNLKLNIKNTQLAEVLKIKKAKLSPAEKKKPKKAVKKAPPPAAEVTPPKVKARILPPEKKPPPPVIEEKKKQQKKQKIKKAEEKKPKEKIKVIKKEEKKTLPVAKEKPKKEPLKKEKEEEEKPKKLQPPIKIKEEEKKVSKPKKYEGYRAFDSRARLGLREEEEEKWRRRRPIRKIPKVKQEIPIVRPKHILVRLPISLKDLASAMKIKASELISKLFIQGIVITLNDYLDDETTVQLLGHEFDCEITIDKREEERIQITKKTIREEIKATPKENLKLRPPVIAFMGHVDHGKTSIIDNIRKSNIAAAEAGAITQHIGAFTAKTSLGKITILDTPGHEAFTEMRERGANVTDIVILVIAGDEGIREQTIEALNQAKKADVSIIVAINKADKEGFDAEKVYRQLADHGLIPEAWGGTTITVNCSAKTGQGINDLLEMISLQAEILELKANPLARARGTVLESQMHKGLGAVATILVQNGTLKINDSFVFSNHWGRIKTMHDQYSKTVFEAGPSTPVKITGLSYLAEAGCEIIVVADEKEAKEIAKDRAEETLREKMRKAKTASLEELMEKKKEKKILSIILRADVQGSLEALQTALKKIHSKKVDLNIISVEVGEVSESDIQLAAASNAVILGFHTRIESHAEPLIKQLNVKIVLHNIIYHAVDEVKQLMKGQLDKIEEENDTGTAEVKTIFKSSLLGKIAGCLVTDGIIKRGQHARLIRNDEVIWKGIASQFASL